ncbi:gastrokine-1-like [Gastrophryne carolinensis]
MVELGPIEDNGGTGPQSSQWQNWAPEPSTDRTVNGRAMDPAQTKILLAILGLSFASDNVDINNSGNNGGNIHQTVNINNQDRIASVNQYDGWKSWNSIWDFNRGLFAARLLSRRACVVSRMNRNLVPSLEAFGKITQENSIVPPQNLAYIISQTRVKNVATFGRHIEALCKGVPTFYAQEIQDPSFYGTGCSTNGIVNILGITICGGPISYTESF